MFEEFLFTIKLVEESGVRTVYFSCVTSPDYEWRLNTQMRIKTGTAGSTALRVVDKDVFEFYPRCDPVSVELMSDAISIVKFELRILNKLIERLPTFREGDLIVLFSDGSTIKVHRELVALYSTYIKKCTEGSEVTSVENFSKKAFIEMLYHIYPTLRPLYRNLRDFAKAAVSYEATPLIYQLSKHLVNFNTRSMSLEQKLRAALDLELGPAVEELVYRAAQDGVWNHLIKLGFEPENFFGAEVYRKLVCPAIFAGRQNEYGKQFIEKPFTFPDFFSEQAAQNPSNKGFLFRRTPFYVNRGILEAHGTSRFAVNSDGLLLALFSHEMGKECERGDILPGEVVVSILNSMYPLGPAVPVKFLRAAIVFCHDHDWIHMKNQLEQNLLQQPPKTWEEYRDQIIFAERFKLENMLATSVQRAEGSCNNFAEELRKSDDFKKLHTSTRNLLVDRLCSGWGLEPKLVNRLATREPSSFRERKIGLNTGGPRAFEEERQAATLAEMIKWIILIGALCPSATSFIIGGCIGPKSVLERYLNPKQKTELRKLIHTQFDGKNAEQVLAIANTYVHSVITPKQWLSILPELRVYQTRRRECSIYSQLLPSAVYKQLLNSVWAAMEHGVNDSDLKRLVDEYVDRAIKSGMIIIDKTYTKARSVVTTTPKTRIFSSRLISEIDPQSKATKRREYPSYRRLPSGNIDVWVP
ncbi:hypothetical protein V3C99_018321 [Haemonchus contortus]